MLNCMIYAIVILLCLGFACLKRFVDFKFLRAKHVSRMIMQKPYGSKKEAKRGPKTPNMNIL